MGQSEYSGKILAQFVQGLAEMKERERERREAGKEKGREKGEEGRGKGERKEGKKQYVMTQVCSPLIREADRRVLRSSPL